MGPSSFRQMLPAAAVAVGISTIAFLNYLCLLDSPSHLFIYHIDRHVSTTLFLPVILDCLLLTAIFWAIFVAGRTRPRLEHVVWSVIVCMFPWVLIKRSPRRRMWTSHITLVCRSLFFRSSRFQFFCSFGHPRSLELSPDYGSSSIQCWLASGSLAQLRYSRQVGSRSKPAT